MCLFCKLMSSTRWLSMTMKKVSYEQSRHMYLKTILWSFEWRIVASSISSTQLPGVKNKFCCFYACIDSRWKNLLGTYQKSVKLALDWYPACVSIHVQRKEKKMCLKNVRFLYLLVVLLYRKIFERKKLFYLLWLP